ncbi:MAG TPA: CCA tRNA nucleotidyltransferase [Gemmatimonadales bacterium]|jgi:tRNA nucleotidyltransferase (CCA-adding enzyme)|nr:CCA tRNA nucleotidyltransferase [Gemmatimonadales bacterium]
MSGLPRLSDLPAEIIEIAGKLESAGFETWCVGGALRDRLLDHPSEDVDLATAARPEQVMQLFPRTVAVGVRFGTVGVLDRRGVLHEVTTFRKDIATDGRHAVVEYGASLEEDLARRDFTINALAYHPLRHEWRDPFEGSEDLRRRRVRAVGDPARRFAEDYLRILRALRFAARFEFAIDPATWKAARAGASGLDGLSAERVREEWFKGLETACSLAFLITLWRDSGAAGVWVPELGGEYPFASEAPSPRDPVVLTAGLCRDPATVLQRLRASNAEIDRARAMGRALAEPPSSDPVAVRRWLAEVSDAADDLILLAEYRSGSRPRWAEAVAGIRARGEPVSRAELAVTGDDLRAAGVPAGPEMGRLLGRLLDAALEDPALNSKERLLELVRAWR